MFKRLLPAVPTRQLSIKVSKRGKSGTIHRYLPPEPFKKQKEWEKRGISKDEFFIKKYSFMSDEQKAKLKEKTDRQQRIKRLKEEHKRKDPLEQRDTGRYGVDVGERKKSSNKNPFNEYVYGRHAVLSALAAKKRHLYDRLILNLDNPKLDEIISIAKKLGIKIDKRLHKNDLNILTDNAVHNGVVLETRKLELPELDGLGEVNLDKGMYELVLWNLELNTKSGVHKQVARKSTSSILNPLGIYLDEVTDPQNVGAIIRSAYFLGVDFIVTPAHNTARLGPATSKASAGALDLMDIYQVNNGLKFMRHVKESPWSIVTTDVKQGKNTVEANDLSSILTRTPVMLVLGSEGTGVRTNIKSLSDFFVSLPKNRVSHDAIVDSLNVSSATSILISKFLD